MYDYEDLWSEPSEFEQQIEEFKEALRDNVKKEIKDKIARLEKELAELNEFKKDKAKIIKECEAKVRDAKQEAELKIREAEASEKKWKKARLHQLLGENLTVGWKVGYSYEYGEKCDKCDDKRYIHFSSPQGREYKEECACAKKHYRYFPTEAMLEKFYVSKTNFPYSSDTERSNYYNRYYTVIASDKEVDRYEYTDDIYPSLDGVEYEKINSYRAVFLNEEDCKKYCDWKNEEEREV